MLRRNADVRFRPVVRLAASVAAFCLAAAPTLGRAEPAAVLERDLTPLDPASFDIPGELVVDARDDLDASGVAALFASFGLAFVPTATERDTRAFVVDVKPEDEAAISARLASDGRVEYVEPVARVRALFAPNDPLYTSSQWHLTRVGAPKAWDFATGRGVTVAVVDTGLDLKHSAFQGSLSAPSTWWDFHAEIGRAHV